jgi:CubicO group peptidase (beta-lactamase class C family)
LLKTARNVGGEKLMNYKKFVFGSLAIGAGLVGTHLLFARSASSGPGSKSPPYESIDAYVEEKRRHLKIPGVSLAIVEGDRIVHLRGFGRARPGGEVPTPQTPFPIASLTKSFTALAVMQLVESGKIELDAPVQRYLPWFRVADLQASAEMTVRHLLIQTSGLPTSSGELLAADFDDSPGAAERQARALSTLVLTRPVGSAHEYSNANYLLLGLTLEVASGESYADYVQRHILAPLGMSHTYTSQAEAKENGLAVGHRYWFAVPLPTPHMPLPQAGLAGGGLISSAEDMARYLIAHLNGGRCGDAQVLSVAGIEEMHRGAADIGPEALPQDLGVLRLWLKDIQLGQYGMGWFVDKIGETNVVSHGGTLPDFGTYMAILPEQKKGLVLLFNGCHHWMNPALTEFGMGAASLLAGEQSGPQRFLPLIPWVLRSPLILPAAQIVGVAATRRLLRRWRLDPERRPSSGRAWVQHVLLPLIPNLWVALNLIPMLDKRRDYRLLYKPDSSWLVLACGSFALVWSFLRTGLLLQALRKSPVSNTRSPIPGTQMEDTSP